jgi:putative methylase
MIHSQSRLAVELSKLKVFDQPDATMEQYPMDSEIGAEVLWNAQYAGDLEGKTIADLGCGTGILGTGALLLGAKRVCFVDTDLKALDKVHENIAQVKQAGHGVGDYTLFNLSVTSFQQKVDVVIQNPPFGTKKAHADREFLVKAFELARVVYSFHKSTSKDFLAKISSDHHFKITHYWEFNFPIKATQLFHKRKIHRVKVGCWRMERRDLKGH